MKVKIILIVEGGVNLAMMLLKLGVGLATGSVALISDAAHSFSDFGNNVVAWVAQGVSEKKADDNHHYGHGKAEQLAVFTLAILLIVVAIEIIISAFKRHGAEVIDSQLGLFCMGLVLVANLILTIWQHYWAKRLQSHLLAADAKHTLSDVLTTGAAIAGWQFAAKGLAWLDTVAAIIVAILIAYLAASLLRRSTAFLMDYSELSAAEIRECVLRLDDVIDVQRVRARTHHDKTFADLTIKVTARMTTARAHEISDLVEAQLARQYGIEDVVVHIEPDR